MRPSMKTSRTRLLLVPACVLLFGSALATTATPAEAAPNVITFTVVPANQTINPLPRTVALQATATDSDTTATLTYSAGTPSTLPPGVTINATTGAITGTATTAFAGT